MSVEKMLTELRNNKTVPLTEETKNPNQLDSAIKQNCRQDRDERLSLLKGIPVRQNVFDLLVLVGERGILCS